MGTIMESTHIRVNSSSNLHPARQEVPILRTPLTTQTVQHKRVKSFDSFCFPADLTSTHRTPDASTASKNASTELQLQALQRELNRTRLVFSELLSAQDAEILRLTDLLNNAGLDGDGNPLPTGADLYTDAL